VDVGHLSGDGLRGVVAPPVAATVRVRGAGDLAGDRAAILAVLVVLDALLVLSLRRAGGGSARLGLRHAGPATAVEPDAEQQLGGRDAQRLELLDRGGGAEALGRDARVGRQRRLRSGRAVGGGSAEEVVRYHVVPVDVLRGARVISGID